MEGGPAHDSSVWLDDLQRSLPAQTMVQQECKNIIVLEKIKEGSLWTLICRNL